MFFRRDPAVYCQHYPVFSHKFHLCENPPLPQEGEFASSSACQHCPGRFTATPSLVQGIESKFGFNNLIVKSAKDKLLKSIVRDAKKMGQALRFV